MIDFDEKIGWRRGWYKNGLKHGLERNFAGIYPDSTTVNRVAFYCNDDISGIVWQKLIGGAFMVGIIENLNISPPDYKQEKKISNCFVRIS